MAKILGMEAAKTLKMGDGRGKSEVNGEVLSLVRLRCLLLVSSLIYPLITSTILHTMPPASPFCPRYSIKPLLLVYYLHSVFHNLPKWQNIAISQSV